MRLWSLHPSALDRIGLVALWREGLLAQKVLLGETKGYMHVGLVKPLPDALEPPDRPILLQAARAG